MHQKVLYFLYRKCTQGTLMQETFQKITVNAKCDRVVCMQRPALTHSLIFLPQAHEAS